MRVILAFGMLLISVSAARADWMADGYKQDAALCLLRTSQTYQDALAQGQITRVEVAQKLAENCARVFAIWTDYIGMDRQRAADILAQALLKAMEMREPFE